MKQDVEKIRAVYDAVAKEYADTFLGEHEKKPKDQEVLLRFSQAIEDRGPVWDFGCGPGQTAAYLKALGVNMCGLDISEKILAQAREAHPAIHFQQGNLLDLEFESNSIAGVVAFYAIVHFTMAQLSRAFREISRVLQPEGLFLFTYHVGEQNLHVEEFLTKRIDIDFMFFRTDAVSRCLIECGFEIEEMIEREPYPDVEYQSRRAYVFARKVTS